MNYSIELLFVSYICVVGRNFIFLGIFRSLVFILPKSIRLLLAALIAVIELRLPSSLSSFSELLAQSILFFLTILPLVFAAEAIMMDGRLADVYRGAQFAEQNFLKEQQKLTVLEQLSAFLAAYFLLIISSDIFEYFNSLSFNPEFYRSSLLSIIEVESVHLFADALLFGVLLSAPCLLLALSVDCSAALANKLMPKISFLFELFPLKLIACIWLYSHRLGDTPYRALDFSFRCLEKMNVFF